MRVSKELKKMLKEMQVKDGEGVKATKQLADHARRTGFVIQKNVKRRGRNKKGSVLDLFPLGFFMLSFALAIIVGFTIYGQILDTGAINASGTASTISSTVIEQYGLWDNIFLALLVAMSLTAIIAAAKVRTSPMFFFLSLVLLAIVIMIGMFMTNAFSALTTGNVFSSASSTFPKIFFIMDNLGLYFIVMGSLISIALYSFRGERVI
jgi:hypothetical protein